MKLSLLIHKHITVRQLIYCSLRGLFKLQLAKQGMPIEAKSSIAKVRRICQEYPDKFSATPAGDLRCNLCDVFVKCDAKFFVESHRKSKIMCLWAAYLFIYFPRNGIAVTQRHSYTEKQNKLR